MSTRRTGDTSAVYTPSALNSSHVFVLLTALLLAPVSADAGQRIVQGLPLADPMPTGESDLRARIFFSSNQIGEFEPCSCPDTPLGGLAQQAGFVDAARAEEPLVFWFDAGDRFFRHNMAMSSVEEALRRRTAILMVDSASRAGIDAQGVGRLDLGAGLPYLRKLAVRSGTPLLSANLVDDDGALLFSAFTIIERGGLKVGVTSVVGSDTSGTGYRAIEPVAAAKSAIKALRESGADLVVLLSNVDSDDDKRIARMSRPDLLVGSRSRDIHASGPVVGKTVVARAGSRGRYLGDVRWYGSGRGKGPHLVATVAPVLTSGPKHAGVDRLVAETLRLLADPVLGVIPFEPGEAGRPEAP
jgi:2',3'-cyclic-nucleotide 2'-phosphodiesterase (5'-nucleotidase family)